MAINNLCLSEESAYFIISARRLKSLLKHYDESIQGWLLSMKDERYALKDEQYALNDEQCNYFGLRQNCVPVLMRIVAVYDLYRDNQFAPGLTEYFWRSRECLRDEISSFFDDENDLSVVCDLVSKLYQENQNATVL